MKYRVFAHSRSGHHAFINWFANQFDSSVRFHNNCMKGWKSQNLISNKNKIDLYGNKPFVNEIYSFEYLNLDDYIKYDFKNWDDDYIDILFIRDFFNWAASSYKRKDDRFYDNWTNVRGETEIPIIDLWIQYAKESIEKKILKENFVVIKYNDWFKSKEYRKSICDIFSLNFNDKGLNTVSKYGDGSSYSKLKISTNAQNNLLTDQRWKNHVNDSNFLEIIDNDIAIELNEKIFNMTLESKNPLIIK